MAELTKTGTPVVDNRQFGIETGRATGSGAIAATYTCTAKVTQLLGLRLHLSAAPTTSEDFTVTIDGAVTADVYDTELYSEDLSASSVTDLLLSFENVWLEADEEIDIAFTNTDGGTYGLELICKVYN